MAISHLKWSKKNELLTLSEDCNGYVVSFHEASKTWKTNLINVPGTSLRALCAGDWNDRGDRFAIAGSRGDAYVGFFNSATNQWDTGVVEGTSS